MTRLNRLLASFTDFLAFVAASMLVLMTVHVVLDASGRYLFSFPLDGTMEIVAHYYMVGLIYLPLAYVQRNKSHIVAEIFTQNLGQRPRLFLDAAIGILMVAYVALFTWRTGMEAYEKSLALEHLEAMEFFVYIWPGRWFLPIGFAVMGIYALLQTIQSMNALASHRQGPDDA
jgi:TRAP-type C4-dicarboxylate transport system permease small subunit